MPYTIIKSQVARKLWVVRKDGKPVVAFTSASGARKHMQRLIEQDAKEHAS